MDTTIAYVLKPLEWSTLDGGSYWAGDCPFVVHRKGPNNYEVIDDRDPGTSLFSGPLDEATADAERRFFDLLKEFLAPAYRLLPGWTPTVCGRWLLREGDGKWLRQPGMEWQAGPGDWRGLLPTSAGTPSVQGCLYRRPAPALPLAEEAKSWVQEFRRNREALAKEVYEADTKKGRDHFFNSEFPKFKRQAEQDPLGFTGMEVELPVKSVAVLPGVLADFPAVSAEFLAGFKAAAGEVGLCVRSTDVLGPYRLGFPDSLEGGAA